jgi:tellurite resistance protein TerC
LNVKLFCSTFKLRENLVRHFVIRTLKQAKRLAVIVIGFTTLVVGIAMIVLPGPAVVVIPIALTILATEFLWARKLLVTVKERIGLMRKKGTGSQNKP